MTAHLDTAALGNSDPTALALAHPLDGEGLAITGPARSGKSRAVIARAARAAESWSGGARTIVGAPDARRVALLASALDRRAGLQFATLEDVAFELLELRARERGIAGPCRIDDVRAAALFEPIGASLFALDWEEFVTDEIDPEITGLRAPERFAAAAFRLIRKLRAAALSPADFKRYCYAGATNFYAHLPNFSTPELILDTQEKYRDSLRASPDELARQHAREIDLAKILIRLYETYTETLIANGSFTGSDALLEAADALRREPATLHAARERWRAALIDDAQDCTAAHVGFVDALFGERRFGVTFAGDERSTTTTFDGAVGKAAFKGMSVAHELPPRISRLGIARAVEIGAAGPPHRATIPRDGSVEIYRASDKRDEASWVAATIATLVRGGTPPNSIAVIARSLGCASVYIDALLARDVPVDLGGRVNLYDVPAASDALAILWALADPYRHDWLLRVLESPSVALADASLATLCSEPATTQTPLFELPDDDADEIRGRWDRRRDLRLGRNVTHGDVDADLPDEARVRVAALRDDLKRYEGLERELDLADLARAILDERALATPPGSARARFDAAIIERICDDVAAFAARDPLATLHDYLLEVERACTFDADLLAIDARDRDAVSVLDVEAAKGLGFAHVFVVDVRAGAFPQYYVPDAFLFTPKYGMVAKENVGDASAARTAKFTYLFHAARFKQQFIAQERRAFGVAASRASERLYIGTSGRPTKGYGAPEIAAELRERIES